MVLLLLGVGVAGLAVAGAAFLLWRRHRERVQLRTMASRLTSAYPPPSGATSLAVETFPLRRPQGCVAVQSSGLCLHVGLPPEDLRHVPWSGVNSVVPVADGRFVVEVSKVGRIEISGEVGRRLWEVVGERRAPLHEKRPERARAARV